MKVTVRNGEYVRENTVRAGLVPQSEQWLRQGEFVVIDRA